MLPPNANVQLLARLPEKNVEKAVFEIEQDRMTRHIMACARVPGQRVKSSPIQALLAWIFNRPSDVQIQTYTPRAALDNRD